MPDDTNNFKMPDLDLPDMQLYYELDTIAKLYDKHRWNSEVQIKLYLSMYLLQKGMMKENDKRKLKIFLESIQKNPNVMPEIYNQESESDPVTEL